MRVNEPVLDAVLATIKSLAGRVEAAPPQLDGILALKGVIEVIDEDEREEDRRAAEAAVIAGFQATLAELAAMRQREGEALGQILCAAPGRDRRAGRARRGRARPPARGDQGAASPSRSRRCSTPPSASIPTGCTRKRS